MDQDLLVDQQEDAEKLVNALKSAGLSIPNYFWIKAADAHQWQFYVVSPNVTLNGQAATYREVHKATHSLEFRSAFNAYDVRLITPDSPLNKAVAALQQKHGANLATWYGGLQLGDMEIDQAYFYKAMRQPTVQQTPSPAPN